MTLFILILSLLSFNCFASLDATTLCESNKPGNMITAPLHKSGKYQWCISAHCILESGTSEREKCVRHIEMSEEKDDIAANGIRIALKDSIRAPNLSASKSKGNTQVLYPDSDCFNECRPQEEKKLFGRVAIKYGLENEKCAACAIKFSIEKSKSYEVQGHGVTVYEGQQCYSLCKLPMGDYQETHPYSEKCLTCIGSQGFKPTMDHLVNQKGECFEMREDGANKYLSQIPEKICKEQSNVYNTYFKKTSTYTISYMLFKEPQKCLEIDEKTGGDYYKRMVSMAKCDAGFVNDNERGAIKDTPKSSGQSKSSSSEVKKN